MKAAVVIAAAAGVAQAHLADHIEVKVDLVNNNQGGPWPIPPESSAIGADWGFFNNVTVTVTAANGPLPKDGFALYFSTPRRVLAINTPQFTVAQETGDLYKLTPTDKFKGLAAKGQVTIPLVWEYWVLQKTDFMPRWYVVEGTKAKVIKNTDVEDFSFNAAITKQQFKRSGGDVNVYQTPATRFDLNKDLQEEDVSAKIIPTPLEVQPGTGVATFGNGFAVTGLAEPHLAAVNERLDTLKLKGSFPIKVAVDAAKVPAAARKAEGYTVTVGASEITVTGYDNAGAFYGVQSVLALVTPGQTTIPQLTIVDSPRFAYRGQHADVARNFHKKETILRLLDQMAAYKLNKFLLHASDDEGWRIEIDGLPELTSLGATRCHDETEQTCLKPQLGSGPDGKALYYTKADYIEIVKYAAARNIEVIPEIDMPAHARAAVRSMEARAAAGDASYRLLDPEDKTQLATVQYYGRDSFINPCVPGSKKFVEKVIAEVKKMHEAAGVPLKKWSWGGDEAKNAIQGTANDWPKTDNFPIWNVDNVAGKAPVMRPQLSAPFAKSPACQGQSADELTKQFAITVAGVAKAAGVEDFQSWQDGVKKFPASELGMGAGKSTVMDWDALFWGTEIDNHVKMGYNVVSANPDFTYFDMPYETSPEERGYYWASRGTNLKKTFSFAPVNVYQNAETSMSRDNTPYSLETMVDPTPNVVGMQGHVWTETVRTADQFDYMAFPRVLALAERAWHKATFELQPVVGQKYGPDTNFVNKSALNAEFNTFINVVGKKELPKLAQAGVAFRVPPAGAQLGADNQLRANSEIPGVTVQYAGNRDFKGPVYTVGAAGVAPQTGDIFVRSTVAGLVSRVETVATCTSAVTHITDAWCKANRCPTPVCTLKNEAVNTPPRKCVAKKNQKQVTDEWCQNMQCASTYNQFCEWQQ